MSDKTKSVDDQILKGIEEIGEETKAIKTNQQKMLEDYDRLDKDTKKAFEELTTLKKAANDTQAGITAFTKKLGEVQRKVHIEERSHFGDPVRRLLANEETKERLNLAMRLALDDSTQTQRKKLEPRLKAIGEDSGVGATLIDDKIAPEIYDTLSRYGVWNTFAVRRLATKQTKFPVKTARPIANFVLAEAGTIADDTNKAGTSVTLEVEVIATLLNISRQLLDDAEFDVAADCLDDFFQATAERIDVAALTADGTSDATNGAMTGVVNGGTLAAAAATHATVGALTLDDFIAVLTAVDPDVLNRQTLWWTHPYTIVRMLGIRDSNGRPIFLTANEAPSPGGIGSILGSPVVLSHKMSSANVANTRVAVFGDPNSQVVGIRQDFSFESSDHARWTTFERSFRGVARAGTKIRRAAGTAVLRTTT